MYWSSEKIRLDVSNELQRIQMKNQALFSSKDKSKKLKCRLLQFLYGTFRVMNSVKMNPQLPRNLHEAISSV